MSPTLVALALGLGIVAFGLVTGAVQVRGLRRLRGRTHVPSDELRYLRGKHRRRLVTAIVFTVIGGMVVGAYISGMEEIAEAMGQPRPADAPPMTDAERQFIRFWTMYWGSIAVLLLALVGLGFADAVANRIYWMGIYRELRDEHKAKLRRDLAVYRQHKEQNRAGPGRLGPVGDLDD